MSVKLSIFKRRIFGINDDIACRLRKGLNFIDTSKHTI